MNNDKYQLYADRIQNTLMRPEVLTIMQQASTKKAKNSKDPLSSSKPEE